MEPVSFTAEDVEGMARRTLQQHCKKLSIKANGKNVEMKQRLIEYLEEYERQQEGSEAAAEESTSMEEVGTIEEMGLDNVTSTSPDTQRASAGGAPMQHTAEPENLPSDCSIEESLTGTKEEHSTDDDMNPDASTCNVEQTLSEGAHVTAEDVIMEAAEGAQEAGEEPVPVTAPATEVGTVVAEDTDLGEDMVMEEVADTADIDERQDNEDSVMEDVPASSHICEHTEQRSESVFDNGLDSTVTEDDIAQVATETEAEAQDCPRLSACADSAMDLEEEEVTTPNAAMLPVIWSPAVQRAVNDSGELCLSGEHRPFSLLESPMRSPIQSRPNVRSDDVQASSPEVVPLHIMDLEIQAASPVLHAGLPACTPLQAALARPKTKVTMRPTRQLTAPAVKLPSALAGLKKTSTLATVSKTTVPAKKQSSDEPAKKQKAPVGERQAGKKRKARDFDAIHERQFSKLKSIADCVPSKPLTKKRRMDQQLPATSSGAGAVKPRSKASHVTPGDSENTIRARSGGKERPRTTSSKRGSSRPGSTSKMASSGSKRVQPLAERKNTLSATRQAASKQRGHTMGSSSSKSSAGATSKRSSSKPGSKPRMSIAERSMAAAKEKARKFGYTSENGSTVR